MSNNGPQLMAGKSAEFGDGDTAEALDLMARALAILDANDVPADAGAHLDHAMHRLRDWIAERQLR